jgi:hypothetical protein
LFSFKRTDFQVEKIDHKEEYSYCGCAMTYSKVRA